MKLQVGITRKYGILTGDVTTVGEHVRDSPFASEKERGGR